MGYTDEIIEQFGIKNSYQIPILPEMSQLGDEGIPIVLGMPDGMEIVQKYTCFITFFCHIISLIHNYCRKCNDRT
jgi:hypothetical protein